MDDTGALRAVIAAGSVNYRGAQGAWQVIDDTLENSPTGWRNRANRYEVVVPRAAGGERRVSVGKGWVALSLVGASGAGIVAGSRVDYPGALAGVRMRVEATPDAVKETMRLDSPVATRVFRYRLTVAAGLRAVAADGGVRVVDGGGRVVFVIPAGVMADAGGEVSGKVAMSLSSDAGGEVLEVRPSDAWLDAAGRRWPVDVDPTVTTPGASVDCSIISGASASTSFCGDQFLKIGFDGANRYRALVRFDTSAIPAQAQVLGAFVALRPTGATGAGSLSVTASGVTKTWTAAATWNTRDGSVAWATPGGDVASPPADTASVDSSPAYKGWDVPVSAQGWINGTTANNGVLLAYAGSANNVISFAASEHATSSIRPYLSVQYQQMVGDRGFWQFPSWRMTDRLGIGVNVASGNLLTRYSDLVASGKNGMDLGLDHTYNSRDDYFGAPHGNQWRLSASEATRLYLYGRTKVLVMPNGARVGFAPNASGGWDSPAGLNAGLVQNPDGSLTVTFNRTGARWLFTTAGVLSAMKDRAGNTIGYAYDGSGRLQTVTDTRGRQVTASYTGSGYLDRLTDWSGRYQQFGYDAANNLKTITDANGKTTTFTYVSAGLNTITDPDGRKTVITADASGRVTSVKRVTNNATMTGHTWSFSYTASTTGCPTGTVSASSVTDPNAHVARWCIDAWGRVVRSFDGRGKQRSTTFSANSDVTGYTSGTGAVDVTNYSTDGLNNPINGTTGPGAAWSMTYAAPGQPYLPSQSTDAQGKNTNMRYDPNGYLCSMNNGATAPPDCTTGISGSGQLRMARGAATAPGAVSAITDGRGNTTTLAYNSLGELTSVTPPDTTTLGVRSFTYDTLSRVATVTDGKGQVTTYTYDPLDRVTSIAYQGGATVSWTYDAAGNRASMTDQAGTTTYTYDPLQRLTTEAKPVAEGGTNTYTYDPVGNMLTLTSAGETVTYAYDAADNVQTITEPGGNITTLAYNDNEQLSTTTFPTATGVVETRTYEGDRLARVRATKGATVITDFGYCYRDPVSACGTTSGTVRDLVSRMQDLAEGDTTTYTYDNLGRLTNAATTGTHPRTDVYGYDDASNRTTEQTNGGPVITSVFNPNNQVTSRGSTTYSFDKNGNRIASSAGEAYVYNSKDQATSLTGSVTLAGVAYAGPGEGERYQVNSTSYTNDVLGTGAETTGTTTTRYTRNPDTGGAPLGIRQALDAGTCWATSSRALPR